MARRRRHETRLDVDLAEQIEDMAEEVAASLPAAVGNLVYQRWRELAGVSLFRSRDAYLEALQPPFYRSGKVTVKLGAGIADMVENGVEDPFDLKPGLLKGRAWRDIPITDAVPTRHLRTATVRNKALVQQGRGRAVPVTTARQAILAKLGHGERSKGRRGRTQVQAPGIYRVSVNSLGWFHPGILAVHLKDRVLEDFDAMVEASVADIVASGAI